MPPERVRCHHRERTAALLSANRVSPQWPSLVSHRGAESAPGEVRRLREDHLGIAAMSPRRLLMFPALGAMLAACTASTGPTGPKEIAGTASGAVAGGLIGNAIGGSASSRLAGTVAGAAIGGLIGNRIGAALDEEDRRRAYAAQLQALEAGPSGAPVSWRNPASGRYGNVVPGPAYQAGAVSCRELTHTVYADSTPQIARGTACRNADGTWTTTAN